MRQSFNGPSTLYRVDLTSGAAVPINGTTDRSLSTIGTGQVVLADLAIALK